MVTVKSTSFNLGEHFDEFLSELVSMGRFSNKGEAVRAGLRLLEVEEQKLLALREHLATGEEQAQRGEFQTLDREHFKSIASRNG